MFSVENVERIVGSNIFQRRPVTREFKRLDKSTSFSDNVTLRSSPRKLSTDSDKEEAVESDISRMQDLLGHLLLLETRSTSETRKNLTSASEILVGSHHSSSLTFLKNSKANIKKGSRCASIDSNQPVVASPQKLQQDLSNNMKRQLTHTTRKDFSAFNDEVTQPYMKDCPSLRTPSSSKKRNAFFTHQVLSESNFIEEQSTNTMTKKLTAIKAKFSQFSSTGGQTVLQEVLCMFIRYHVSFYSNYALFVDFDAIVSKLNFFDISSTLRFGGKAWRQI